MKINVGLIFMGNSHVCTSSWTPQQIAEHLTIIDYEVYSKIHVQELKEKRWQHKNKNELAPNLVFMASRFNEVSFWVASQVVEAKKKNIHGSVVIKYFIKVMQVILLVFYLFYFI